MLGMEELRDDQNVFFEMGYKQTKWKEFNYLALANIIWANYILVKFFTKSNFEC